MISSATVYTWGAAAEREDACLQPVSAAVAPQPQRETIPSVAEL